MKSTGRGATLPVFIQHETVCKHNSLDSLSDMMASFADVGGAIGVQKEKPFSPDD
ncbi:hypothetical protein BD779DRAFT_1562143 [Infundibulicybe gibba]|nr:hypothetical protein BD779DRAFT_1562143 [Infundibulicybe gibba]